MRFVDGRRGRSGIARRGSRRPVATFRRDDSDEPVAWEDRRRAVARLHRRSRGAGGGAPAPVASRSACAGARPPSPRAAWTAGRGPTAVAGHRRDAPRHSAGGARRAGCRARRRYCVTDPCLRRTLAPYLVSGRVKYSQTAGNTHGSPAHPRKPVRPPPAPYFTSPSPARTSRGLGEGCHNGTLCGFGSSCRRMHNHNI